MFSIDVSKVHSNEYITTFVINRMFDRLLNNDIGLATLYGKTALYEDQWLVRVYENEYVGHLVLNRSLNKLFENDQYLLSLLPNPETMNLPFATLDEVCLYPDEYFSVTTFNRCISRLQANDLYLFSLN